jgi:hypothetical protein
MTATLAVAAVLLGAAGSALLYLVAPHQRLLARRPPKRLGLWVGGLALLASLVLFRQIMGPASSVFAALTLAMAVFTGLPFLAVVLGHRERQ